MQAHAGTAVTSRGKHACVRSSRARRISTSRTACPASVILWRPISRIFFANSLCPHETTSHRWCSTWRSGGGGTAYDHTRSEDGSMKKPGDSRQFFADETRKNEEVPMAAHPRQRFWMSLVALIALALSTVPGDSAAKDQPKREHCVVHLEPATAGRPSPMKQGPCFATLAESIAAATNGRVQLPATATAAQVDQSLRDLSTSGDVGTATEYVLSIEFWDAYFAGQTYTFTASAPCSPTVFYSLDNFNFSWNDRISSSQGYSNCNKVRHWEHSPRAGATIDCPPSCATMGVMNDATSALEWFYS